MVRTILLAIAFCALMLVVVRRVLGRVSTAYDEAGRVPSTWIVAIFAGVLLSAAVVLWIAAVGKLLGLNLNY